MRHAQLKHAWGIGGLRKEYSPQFALRSRLVRKSTHQSGQSGHLSTFERYVFVELYAIPIRLARLSGFNKASAVEDLRVALDDAIAT